MLEEKQGNLFSRGTGYGPYHPEAEGRAEGLGVIGP